MSDLFESELDALKSLPKRTLHAYDILENDDGTWGDCELENLADSL